VISPRKKKFKEIASASKIMAAVVWNREGVILTDVWPRGQTNNLDVYVKIWISWRRVSRGFVPVKMWQKCFFIITMHGHTQVCIPQTPSQSLSELSCLIDLTAWIWLLPTAIFSILWEMHSMQRSMRTMKSFPK
jgi:hypothetical protein